MYITKFGKKTIAAALCAVMVMSVAACGSETEADTAESSSVISFEKIDNT